MRVLCALPCLLGAVLACWLTFAAGGEVAAGSEWCEADPVVVITTPKGALVPVYVNVAAEGTEHLPAVLAAKFSYSAASVQGESSTLVQLQVLVPDDVYATGFKTRGTASSGPAKTGTVYDTAQGHSGQPMKMTFKLNVP